MLIEGSHKPHPLVPFSNIENCGFRNRIRPDWYHLCWSSIKRQTIPYFDAKSSPHTWHRWIYGLHRESLITSTMDSWLDLRFLSFSAPTINDLGDSKKGFRVERVQGAGCGVLIRWKSKPMIKKKKNKRISGECLYKLILIFVPSTFNWEPWLCMLNNYGFLAFFYIKAQVFRQIPHVFMLLTLLGLLSFKVCSKIKYNTVFIF